MDRKQIPNLLKKYTAGKCTDEEKEIVESWYLHFENNSGPELSDLERAEDLRDIYYALPENMEKRGMTRYLVRAAAVAAIFIAVLGIYKFPEQPAETGLVKAEEQPILPGGNDAILTLEDGTKVSLSDARIGQVNTHAGISIVKTAEGKLVYKVDLPENNNDGTIQKVSYNTIETPKGGEYEVHLPDGSKVWLNAASSLRYPTYFTGNERSVELTGEAYFEIAHNKSKPFRVIANRQTVEVLGTSFNINAYTDEKTTKTTLLAGRIKVLSGNKSELIHPGQQTEINNTEPRSIRISNVNAGNSIAWKNGYFKFENTGLHSLLREIGRWYDIEIVHEGEVKNDVFVGQISRQASLENVLKILELGGVHFRIEGRKLYVLP